MQRHTKQHRNSTRGLVLTQIYFQKPGCSSTRPWLRVPAFCRGFDRSNPNRNVVSSPLSTNTFAIPSLFFWNPCCSSGRITLYHHECGWGSMCFSVFGDMVVYDGKERKNHAKWWKIEKQQWKIMKKKHWKICAIEFQLALGPANCRHNLTVPRIVYYNLHPWLPTIHKIGPYKMHRFFWSMFFGLNRQSQVPSVKNAMHFVGADLCSANLVPLFWVCKL